MKRLVLTMLAAPAAALTLAACGGEDADLTVYSGRTESLVGDLIEDFERSSGLDVEVRYGTSSELAATIAEEGDKTPAQVFFSQDAGALGSIEGQLKPIPAPLLAKVDERWNDPQGRWVGTSGRSRVIAYSTERLKEDDVPDTVFDLVKPEWRGRVAFPPSNPSFQAFVSAMRITEGDERTRAFLQGLRANDPVIVENNIQAEEAIASGEADVALVNHYYLGELKAERPDFPVANHFIEADDPGALVNVAGAGMLEDTPEARRFVEFLLSAEAQEFFRTETFEYPLVEGVRGPEGVPPLDELQGPDVELGDLGPKLKGTLELLDSVGLQA